MVKGGKKKAKGDGRDILSELEFELKLLRSQVRDVGENVILRREGEIEALIGCLSQLKPSRLKADAPVILREVQQLKLKPHKGRLKDLKEIDQLLTLLRDRLEDSPQKGSVRKKSHSRQDIEAAKPADAGDVNP